MSKKRNRLGYDQADFIIQNRDKPIKEIAQEIGVSDRQVRDLLTSRKYNHLTKHKLKEKSDFKVGRKSSTGEKGVAKFRDKFRVVVKGEYIGVYCTLEQAVFARDAALNGNLV